MLNTYKHVWNKLIDSKIVEERMHESHHVLMKGRDQLGSLTLTHNEPSQKASEK